MKSVRTALLVLVSALALSAFAMPAFAQADGPAWHVNGNELEEPITFEGYGELSFVIGQKMGPCAFRAEGTIENSGGQAAGAVEELELLTPACATHVCTFSPEAQNLPWGMSVDGSAFDLNGVSFNDKFYSGCHMTEVTWGGTLEGAWVNDPGNGAVRLEYNKAGALLSQWGGNVTTSGYLSLSALEGGALTLE